MYAIGLDEVEIHIFVNDIDLRYTRWVMHDKRYEQSTSNTFDSSIDMRYVDEDNEQDDNSDRDGIDELLGDIGARILMDEIEEDASSGRGTESKNFSNM